MCAAVLLLNGLAMLAAAPAAHAASPSYNVFVGYVDDLRTGTNQSPTPWFGSTGINFLGCNPTTTCAPAGSFDAGAIRVSNASAVAETVNSVTVNFGGCIFDLWPHNVSMPAGGQLILTQTAAGAGNGCSVGTHTGAQTMDSSDFGPGGAAWASVCTQSNVIPQVTVTVNGVATTYADSGQVLNTNGVDAASCNRPGFPAGNETTQWVSIGQSPCPTGAVLTLTPATQNDPVGTTATVTANLSSCTTPLQGGTVNFAILSGPNAGAPGSGSAVTDGSGNASFSYSSAVTGSDTLQASLTNAAGTITSNNVTVNWQKRATTLTYNGATTSDFHDAATLSARLTDALTGGPITGAPVTIVLNGSETCGGTTNTAGTAACSVTPNEAAGPYTVNASYAGDATHSASGGSSPFTVTLEETTLTYTGATQVANGTPATLSGTLREDGTTAIGGRSVSFTLGSGTSTQTCSGTTSSAGSASCTIGSVAQPSTATSVPIVAKFLGDGFYLPATANAVARLEYMTGRAYGVSLTDPLLSLVPTPDTGAISTSVASTTATPCVVSITSGLLTSRNLCANVTTAVNPGHSTANASVDGTSVGLPLLPAIQLSAVHATSDTTCAGSTGSTTVAFLKIGNTILAANPIQPGVNTTISLLGLKVVLNEQVPVAGGLTVNAVHVSGLGLDLVVASATSDIHNCP